MTKPTGRPRGRPKTKEYVTLMARVPQDLAERVQRYAGRKRLTMSDVLRDGLLVLLEDEDPYRPFLSDRNADASRMSDTKTDVPALPSDRKTGTSETQASSFVSDIKEDKSVIMSDVKAAEKASSSIVYDNNEGTENLSDTKEEGPAIVSDTIPPFDPQKFALGKLCPRGHEYHGTGKTLLRLPSHVCPQCDAARARERRQEKSRK